MLYCENQPLIPNSCKFRADKYNIQTNLQKGYNFGFHVFNIIFEYLFSKNNIQSDNW